MKPTHVTSIGQNSVVVPPRSASLAPFLFLGIVWISSIYAEAEPRYLIPSRPSDKAEESSSSKQSSTRSSYESLTEPKGTLKVIKDRHDRAAQEQLDRENQKKAKELSAVQPSSTDAEGPVINFSNVSITEVIKYVSRLTGKNFIYDPQELQFNVTMISDSSSSLEEILAMVIQSLRAHGYAVLEEGGNFVIHTNPTVRAAGAVEEPSMGLAGPQIATRVFVLQNLGSDQCSAVIKAMVTEGALVEPVGEARIVVSDITENLNRIAEVIRQMDTATGGLEIGQYVAVNSSPATLVSLADRILAPIAGDRPLVLVPHATSNSVFIVSTPFLIEKALSIMQATDLNISKSGLLDQLRFDRDADERARMKKAYEAAQYGQNLENEPSAASITDDDVRRYLTEQGIIDAEITQDILDAAKKAILEGRQQRFLEGGGFLPGSKMGTPKRQYTEGDMPLGTVEATKFLIYRLQYRKSSDIVQALRSIAESLAGGDRGSNGRLSINPALANSDLIVTLNSLQPVDDNNTIVFTGTAASLQRAKDLIQQIDIPVRQVFIEALVLDTSITNSLNFGVEWAGKIERTNFAAGVGFRSADPKDTFGPAFDAVTQTAPNPMLPVPPPSGLSTGFLGRKIKFLGKGFRSTGALLQALQVDDEVHIIMNPKIVTEHNVPAEIFVGQQTPIKGQSIANASIGATSSVVATNYETQETGISLKVTPLISSKDTVTLIIEQKVSSVNQVQVNAQGLNNAPPATVKETRTVTRVHLPSDHFLVISGMIGEDTEVTATRIPCLGSLPIIGTAFGTKTTSYDKRNLMIFIRPVIVDTPNDIDEITKAQENIMKQKSTVMEQGWNKDADILKDMLNLEPSIF